MWLRVVALWLVCGLPAVGAAAENPPESTGYAGEEVCAACHDELAESYVKTPHGQALADAARPEALRGCEACHGPGSLHAEEGGGKGVGGLQAFAASQPVTGRSAVCLGCHVGGEGLHDVARGAHARAAVACTDCHRMHGGREQALLGDALPALCLGCHLEIRAKLALPEHHKVREGVVSCLDCHRPHGEREPAFLRAADAGRCFRCHTDIEGPFVFEHEGLVTEGCASCHDPHGSMNRHLLHRQQVAQLCYQCHVVTPSTHAQPAFRDCTSCHVAIHGSNVDPRFLER